jgi:predicted nucleotidyltransferase
MTLTDEHKNEILDKFRHHLATQESVLFSYAFGSFVNSNRFRDVDIGVFFYEPFHLNDVAQLQTDLQHILDEYVSVCTYVSDYVVDPMDPFSGVPVDIVIMNTLPDNNPELSQDIVNDSICLKQATDYDVQVSYILQSLHQFEDTRYLRSLSEGALLKRLKENRFGERNYES